MEGYGILGQIRLNSETVDLTLLTEVMDKPK